MSADPPKLEECVVKMIAALAKQGGVCEEMFFALTQTVACVFGSEAARVLGHYVIRGAGHLGHGDVPGPDCPIAYQIAPDDVETVLAEVRKAAAPTVPADRAS